MAWSDLVEQLVGDGVLRTPKIIQAFNKVSRKNFVRGEDKDNYDLDRPLSIGYGQTISQPTTVAFMVELLKPEKGQKILDLGSGSGWTSALLAELVGSDGQVFAIEVIPQLKKFGQQNAKDMGYDDIKFLQANGTIGLPDEAPFDRILASATVPEVPQTLKMQLTDNKGRLVIPVGEYSSNINLVKRTDKNTYTKKEYPGFSFVPLVGKKGFSKR